MTPLSTLLVFCNLFMVITETQAGADSSWSYEGKHSPETWHEDYLHCGGRKQSPINILTSEVIHNEKLGLFKLSGYDAVLRKPVLTNNGHSAQINLAADIFLEAGGLPARYKAAQFHFHWGLDDRRGSEHTINGVSLPMEMHIVHYSTEYANLSDALNKPDGLAVVGAFFQIVDKPNPNFEHLVSHFTGPLYKGEDLEIEDFIMRSLLPDDLETFYRYSGSLTTPPCYESVVWTLYQDQVKISEEQLNMFRDNLKANTKTQPEVKLVNDFRPVQPINVRLVETNTLQGLSSGGVTPRTSITFCLTMFCILHKLFSKF